MTDVQTTTDAELRAEEPGRRSTAPTRRVVLLGVGAVGATTVLAACGTGTSSGNANGTDFSNDPAPAGSAAAEGGNGNSGDSGGSSGGAVLATVAEVKVGGGIIKGDYVITQPASGTFKAFSKVCTHQGCDVSKVEGGVINCACHNSNFSIETGEPTSGPANKPLPATEVKVDGDNIVVA